MNNKFLSKMSSCLDNGSRMARQWLGIDSNLSRFSLASLICVCMLTVGSGNAWGGQITITSADITDYPSTAAYGERSWTDSGISGKAKVYGSSSSHASLQFNGSNRTIWNTTPLPGNITSIVMKTASGTNRAWIVRGGTSAATNSSTNTYGNAIGTSTTVSTSGTTFTVSSGEYKYFLCYLNNSNASYIASIVINYEDASCDGLTMSDVTVTPGNTQIALSWPAVANASSYTVTCKNKSTGVAAGTVGGVSGSETKTCTITGLSNGTEYTWSVMPVGTGSYCADNTPATGDATPNVYYTVTWKNNGSTYTTTSVASGQRPTFPANPSSCDDESTTFYGWSTAEWTGKLDDVSAKTIYTSAASMPTVSGAITYYAVFCKGGANGSISITSNDLKSGLGSSYGSGSFTKTISGSNYTFNTYACVQSSTFQMRAADAYIQIPTLPGPITGISSTECHNAGTGNYNGTLRFKSAQAAGNTEDYDLSTKAINATSFSWDISGSYTSGYITTSAGFRLVNLTISYGTPGSKYLTNCCTELASINGSVNSSTPTSVTLQWDKLSGVRASTPYEVSVSPSAGTSVGGIDLSGAKATCSVTGLTPCTAYTFTINAYGDATHCDKSEDVAHTTAGYTLTVTKNGVALSSGSEPSNICANVSATYGASTGYSLPSTITVTNAGAQNTGWTWNSGTGALTINKANVTGNVTVTISGTCVEPAISGDPADASYYVGDSPDALSVSATLASGTLTYLWKVSTDNGANWSNAAGTNNTASYSGASLSTASAGTLKFKCIVGNSQGGCTVESGVATITVANASYFTNGATVFVVGKSSSGGAWVDNACVKACFHAAGVYDPKQETYWIYDITEGGKSGNKMFAVVVPASGNFPYLDLYRFNPDCSSQWNSNGGASKAESGSSNIIQTVGGGTNDVSWYTPALELHLMGDPNSWASSLATFSDQGAGVWEATYNNYAPANAAGESQAFKINDNYGGWFATNNGVNETLSGMHVGSTYNITASYDIPSHTLTMSKTFVKGTVHFNMQSHGSAISDLTNVAAGSKISAPSPAPTDAAYNFGGWFKEPGCTNEWNFASDEVNETMTLYAKWTIKKYAITYNAGANGTGTVPAGEKTHDVSFTLSSSTFSRDHYTQDGWSTEDGGAKVYELGGSYTTNAALTLYPHWTPANYTVTWYAGGTAPGNVTTAGGPSTSVAYNTKVTTLPSDPDGSPCDKVFVGWTNTTSYTHGTSLLFTDAAGSPAITANTNFYAVYATESVGSTTLLEEDFSGITTGNSTSTSGSSSSWGRNSNFSTGAQTYQAGGAVRLGTGSNTGNLTTKQLTAAIGDEITVAFKVKGWSSVEGNISVSGLYSEFTKPSDITYTAVMSGDFESKSVTVTLTKANPYIVIATTANRAFIDDLVITKSGTTYTGHTITCADCGTSVTPTFTAAPAGGTVAVTKGGNAVTSGSTVKTCTSQDLSVTITPASHYTLTGFTASGLSTGTATISPATNTVLPTTSAQTFTVTVSAGATGTLTLTPTFTEDAHKVITWVVHGSSASIAAGHGTTWVYSGEDLTAIPDAPDAPTGCDDKVFVGWSENDGGATEGDVSDYTDLFTNLSGAPTGITTDKTFTAVFATPAAGLGGTVIWDEPWTGYDNGDQPASKSGYNSATISYAYGESGTKVYAGADQHYAGGTQPELMVVKSGGTFTASNIPTAGQTSLTLTYKTNYSANVTVTSGTSGVTVSDPDVSGTTCTRTITISQSPATNNFALTFTMTKSDKNARLDDIHLEVPGSSSMSGYVTTCEDTWTVTYYKNTEDAVTNLPSPTGISKSTGSGTLSSKVPVRYGYTFDGWATSAGGSVAYAAGAAVSSVSADMDLYAKWSVTPVTEINLSKTSLDKYVGDPSVILSVLSVLPDGANTSVTWSSSNPSVATVNSTTGEVNFVAEGTANIIATSTITSGTTATCAVTVWAKPSVSFLDNLHSLTEDKDGNVLSSYNLTDVAGTPVVFPVLANQPAGSGTCEDEFYVFIGWTTSDNNTDPEDHLVTSHNLTNGDNITYYAVWADGVAGTTYTKLTSSTFKTTPTHYVLGAEYNGTTKYFYSCEKTDKNNSWGYVTADLANNSPIEFTLSGTAAALVATSTEVSARYLKPMAEKDFQMSASSQTVELKSDGTIYNPVSTSWKLLYNNANSLRWYDSNISGSANAYFYEVVAGGEVNYRTSCCADKVAAPTVTATKTSTTVTLTWAAVSGATGYELQWNGGAWTAATSGVIKSDLTPNTNYSWRVRATYDPPKCGADIASGSTTTNQVYHVTYVGGSGTGSCNATSSTTDGTAYEAGATVTLQSNGFTLVGHTFNEWTEDDEDITISSNQFTMPEHDVVITATWTPKVDKFYDRMHDGTDASHGGIEDGAGKYYITREGCSYTVPSLTDNTSGATACHTKHYVLMGWTAESHLNSDGTLKTGHEGYVYTGGGTQTATGATYYAVWAEVKE